MTGNIFANYTLNGVTITMSCDATNNDQLPYELAEMFGRIIEDSNANSQIVINELKDMFGYEDVDSER